MRRISLSCAAFIVMAAGSLLLGGCLTAGPDYTPPVLPTPTNWNATVQGAARDGLRDASALSQWWTVFGDPVLTDLVARAEQGNLDVKQAEARLREASANRRLAHADRMPEVGANASGGRSKSSEQTGGGGYRTSYAAGFDASWEMDLFGGKRRVEESAEASRQASGEALRDVRVSILAEVALNYVQLRSAQVRLAILQTNLVAQQDTYDITRWRQQANLVTQLDVDQARVSLEQTRAAIPIIRTTLDQSEHQLALLLGEAPGALRARLATGPCTVPAALRELAIGVPADVLRQRPDVRKAERDLAAQTARIGVAEAARYPDLSLGGSIGLEALALNDLTAAGAWTAQGLLKAGMTVFDGGRIREQVAIETARQEEALAAYQASVLAALKEVEDALVAYANDQARASALAEAAAAGESAFLLARDTYESGLVDFQTVLNTQQSLLTVQNSLASSRADVSSDLIRLYKALGGGWISINPETGTDKLTQENAQ